MAGLETGLGERGEGLMLELLVASTPFSWLELEDLGELAMVDILG